MSFRMRKRKDLRVLRGKASRVIVSAAGAGAYFDAVAEIEAWLEARRALGISESCPLFCHENGRGITVDELRDVVRDVMRAAGRDPALYGAHSLRIGGATAALAAGVPPQLIRLMGRWSSDIYEIYCRMSLESALGVTAAISSAQVSAAPGMARFESEALELLPAESEAMRECGLELAVEEEA